MALAASRGTADYGAFVNEAKALADNQQLDFLEFVDKRGTILSSAQWPAKFGYKESSLARGRCRRRAHFSGRRNFRTARRSGFPRSEKWRSATGRCG